MTKRSGCWPIILLAVLSAACHLNNERIAPDAAAEGQGDASITGDGGVKGCDAAYCCTSKADIPKGLGCGFCGQDVVGPVVCEQGVVACDPTMIDSNRHEVVVIQDWSNGIGDCVYGFPNRPDGGCENGCTDPDVVAHVEGQDDCYKFDFLVDNTTVYYGKEVEFTLTLTNGCSTPIDLHSGSGDWLTINIYTHGVACCPSRESLPAGQHEAILPMDGWNGAEWNTTLQPNASVWMALPWHPEADGMVNTTDAPYGLYDVYALPPTILKDGGDWQGPLSKFLVVRVAENP